MTTIQKALERRGKRNPTSREGYEREINDQNAKSAIQKANELKRKDDSLEIEPGTKTKMCPNCLRTFPLTSDYFRRDKSNRKGFSSNCKTCDAQRAKDHYRGWLSTDIPRRGFSGVRCILWSKFCGRCEIKSVRNECWRVDGENDEKRPIRLGGNDI